MRPWGLARGPAGRFNHGSASWMGLVRSYQTLGSVPLPLSVEAIPEDRAVAAWGRNTQAEKHAVRKLRTDSNRKIGC